MGCTGVTGADNADASERFVSCATAFNAVSNALCIAAGADVGTDCESGDGVAATLSNAIATGVRGNVCCVLC